GALVGGEAPKNGSRVGLAAGDRRGLAAPRAAAGPRHPGHAAGFAHGPPRPAVNGQGGGADRREHRPGILLCTAGGGVLHARGRAQGCACQAARRPAGFSASPPTRRQSRLPTPPSPATPSVVTSANTPLCATPRTRRG